MSEVVSRRVWSLRRRGVTFGYNVWGVLFVVPAALFLLVFNIYPLLNAFRLSFTSWSMAGLPQFNGLDNYITAFTKDVEFPRSLRTTIEYTIGLAPGMALALGLALLFNRPFRGREIFRAIYFTPVVSSWVVVSMVWYIILHPSFGLNAAFFRLIGRPGIPFFENATFVIPAIVIISIWKSVGYWMVIFLAGLQGVPGEFLEAASVDGAGAWRRFWHITLPMLRPTVLFVCVIGVINAFQVFTPIYLLTRGGPAGASRVLPLLIYENAFTYLKMGYATSLSVILFVILMALTLLQIRVLRGGAV